MYPLWLYIYFDASLQYLVFQSFFDLTVRPHSEFNPEISTQPGRTPSHIVLLITDDILQPRRQHTLTVSHQYSIVIDRACHINKTIQRVLYIYHRVHRQWICQLYLTGKSTGRGVVTSLFKKKKIIQKVLAIFI